RDELRYGQPQHEVRKILLTSGYYRLGNAILQNHDVVLIVQLQLGIAGIREFTEEPAGDLGQFRSQLEVEVGAQVGEGPVELLVQLPVHLQCIEPLLDALQLPPVALRSLQ